jgi:hypothetical protein
MQEWRARIWDDLFVVDPDHHDLRVAAVDDHRLPARPHFPVGTVLYILFSDT